jgi:hypothetical protein
MDIIQFTQNYLLFIVMPIWLLVGVLDWWCHRTSSIETTSGVTETIIHLLMLAEGGIAVLLGLFLEINGLVLALLLAAFIAHEITSYWDLSYAAPRRNVRPFEQRVHDYLAVVPFVALSLVFVLHWDQALAWFGIGPATLNLSLELKHEPLPLRYVAGLLAAIFLFEVLPYGEELWRGLRAARRIPTAHRPAARRDAHV